MENTAVFAIVIFVVMYMVIVSEKIHRTIVAMVGAIVMLLTGIISQEAAIRHIDFNTLGLLIGLMIIAMIIGQTGVFKYIAIRLLKKAKADPMKLFFYLAMGTAFLSAALNSVTAMLLMVPVTVGITSRLKVDPVPYLVTQIITANIGAAATLVGSPSNIMIGGVAAELTFYSFMENFAMVSLVILLMVMAILTMVYRKRLSTTDGVKAAVMRLDEKGELKDVMLLKKSLGILALTGCGLIFHQVLNMESSTVALAGAFILLLIARHEHSFIEHAMERVEWTTIFFFIGLFVAVGGLYETGILHQVLEHGVMLAEGDVMKASLLILWFSAIVSAFVDNIPFVAAMIPMLQETGVMTGNNVEPIWWSLTLGACLGGSGTIIGASANLIAVSMAAERGCRISFMRFFKVGFPVMLLTILLSTAFVYVKYLL